MDEILPPAALECVDAATGRLHASFDRDSTFGEPGDGVHPDRAGHAAIARCVAAILRPAS